MRARRVRAGAARQRRRRRGTTRDDEARAWPRPGGAARRGAAGARRAGGEVVEHVVVALARTPRDDAHLLEEVGLDRRAHDLATQVELQHEEFAVARRVVVHHRLRVSEGLHQGRRGDDALLQLGLGGRHAAAKRRGVGQVLEELLGRLGLARAGLARDDHALRARVEQAAVRRRAHAEDVRRRRLLAVLRVAVQDVDPVERQLLVRIDRHEQVVHMRVDPLRREAASQRGAHRRLVQAGKLRGRGRARWRIIGVELGQGRAVKGARREGHARLGEIIGVELGHAGFFSGFAGQTALAPTFAQCSWEFPGKEAVCTTPLIPL